MISKLFTWAAALLGIVFLAVPLAADAYEHHLQDVTFRVSEEQVLTCRAKVALSLYGSRSPIAAPGLLSRSLDTTCGAHPRYDDFTRAPSGILSFYSWLGQKVAFVPL